MNLMNTQRPKETDILFYVCYCPQIINDKGKFIECLNFTTAMFFFFKFSLLQLKYLINNVSYLGGLSENAQVSRNTDFKTYRQRYSRRSSRKDNHQDIINRHNITSDPIITNIGLNQKNLKK